MGDVGGIEGLVVALSGGACEVPGVHEQIECVERVDGLGDGRRSEVPVVATRRHSWIAENGSHRGARRWPIGDGVVTGGNRDVEAGEEVAFGLDHVAHDVDGRPPVARALGLPCAGGNAVDHLGEPVGETLEAFGGGTHRPIVLRNRRAVLYGSDMSGNVEK